MTRQRPKARTYGNEVVAYACRWWAESVHPTDDGPTWTRFTPDAFAGQLESTGWRGLPIIVGHGRRVDSDEPSVILSEPVGELVGLEADVVGLRTTARYRDTHLATQTLAAIAEDVLTAYSLHADVVEVAETDQTREDGLPVVDVTAAQLRECGPTHEPYDPGALIVSAGGSELRTAEPVLSWAATGWLAARSGRSNEAVADEIERRRRGAQQVARDTTDEAMRLAYVVKRARRQAWAARAGYRLSKLPEEQALARAANRAAEDALAELTELLLGDRALVAEVLLKAGVPVEESPARALRRFLHSQTKP